MQGLSLITPGVRYIDKEKVIGRLTELAEQAAEADDNIDRVILFGSLSDDTYTSMSDADLLIILKKSDKRFIDRIPDLLLRFIDAPLPVDVFPYTIEETKRTPFARKAIENGLVLAGDPVGSR